LDYLYERHEGSLEFLFELETWDLREELLSLKGIGPETADSILLYAAGRPVFVVDRYTYRIFTRHGLLSEDVTYDEMQAMFMDNLPEDVAFFNEFHALVVAAGSGFCKKRPRCTGCPLEEMLKEGLEVIT
ncbi:endonuclease III domain-containing protein, partial [Thermodesulfobacteriota bacterium]